MAPGELVFLSIIYDQNDTLMGREVGMWVKYFLNTLSTLLIRIVLVTHCNYDSFLGKHLSQCGTFQKVSVALEWVWFVTTESRTWGFSVRRLGTRQRFLGSLPDTHSHTVSAAWSLTPALACLRSQRLEWCLSVILHNLSVNFLGARIKREPRLWKHPHQINRWPRSWRVFLNDGWCGVVQSIVLLPYCWPWLLQESRMIN